MEKQRELSTDTIQKHIVDGTCHAIRDRYASLAAYAANADFGELDEDVVVLDTETTGFSPNHDELIQIAAARMEHGKITEWFVTFVNPGQPIPEEITHLTGIQEEDVSTAPDPNEALAQLVEFVGGSDIIAHNAEFDHNFTTKYPAGRALRRNTWIDSLDLARIALPRMKSHRLLDLVKAFDAPLSTHRADADVEALCAIYRILLAAIATMPLPLVNEIARMSDGSDWPSVKVFKAIDRLAGHLQRSGSESFPPGSSDSGVREENPAAPAEPAMPAPGEAEQEAAPEGPAPEGPAPEGPAPGTELSTQTALFATEAYAGSSSFSLRALRNSRIGELSAKAKIDADDIAADPQRSLRFPSERAIAEAFSEDGLVGSLYPDYETRAEQVCMSETVLRAFASSTNLAIEAGTGVGKSMAYLLPSALVAKTNAITVGIATKTNALLDQLMFKELPLLAKALADSSQGSNHTMAPSGKAAAAEAPAGKATAAEAVTGGPAAAEAPARGETASFPSVATTAPAADGEPAEPAEPTSPLDYVALKGFSHYPCLRLIDRIVKEGPKSREIAGKHIPQAPSLAALLSFIEQSEYDDIDTLKIDYRILPRYMITTTSPECLRRKCPFYGNLCFVHGARRRAEAADIVVTNHSLLFCDLVADGGLLPPVRYWVVDEAHGTEAEARSAFSLSLSADEIVRLSKRVASDEASQNVFIRAERRAGAALDEGTLFYALTSKAKAAGKVFDKAATEFLRHIKDLAFFDTNRRSKGYETVELWINEDIRGSETFKAVVSYGKVFCDSIEKLITAVQEVVGMLEGIDAAVEAQREIATIAIGLKELLNAAETILFKAPSTYAYSATLSKKPDRISEKLEALLINVGDTLNETLFARTHSVVFTSATLTVADSFDSFETALGLNESEFSQAATCQLDSSYDFDNHMTVYVADDMPEPNDPAYLAALQKFLIEVHRAQGGSMLTLFTNRKEMERCYEVVQEALKQDGLRVVCQKWGVSSKGLRDDFLVDEHLSLFALKSFWEGFDAPGSTLKGVIIPKLPFAKPTDPLSCERAQRDSQAWSHYVLPAAVLETKQAAGRLIRKADDRGCLILADKRLLTKGYGRTFLKSMPSRTIKVCSTAAIAQDLNSLYR